jgi:hypothetical protein
MGIYWFGCGAGGVTYRGQSIWTEWYLLNIYNFANAQPLAVFATKQATPSHLYESVVMGRNIHHVSWSKSVYLFQLDNTFRSERIYPQRDINAVRHQFNSLGLMPQLCFELSDDQISDWKEAQAATISTRANNLDVLVANTLPANSDHLLNEGIT